jgi:hypothetical protein
MQGPGPPTYPAPRADLWGCRAARRFRCLAARCDPRRVRAAPVASVVPDVRVDRPVSAVRDAQVALAVWAASVVRDVQVVLVALEVQDAPAAPAALVVRDVQVVLVALEVQDALAAPVALAVRDVQVVRAVREAWAEREGPAGSRAPNGRLAVASGARAHNVLVAPSAIWGADVKPGNSGSVARRVVPLPSDHSAAEVVAGAAHAAEVVAGVADAAGDVRS